MRLEGSCHCGAVRFALESKTPYPYMRCHCTICRKTAGGGGYAINLGGDAATLEVKGKRHVAVYQARMDRPGDEPDPEISTGQRHFCRRCGSALWLYDPTWPELVHPFASAIDTPLPVPPEHVDVMLDYACAWEEPPAADGKTRFAEYPKLSIEAWHRRHGLYDPQPGGRPRGKSGVRAKGGRRGR